MAARRWGDPADGVGASLSRTALSASGGPAASPERELECMNAPPAHSPRLRPSRSCERSSVITAPRSTGHCGSTAVQCGAFFGYMVAR
jgi:hypothetical protein